LILVAESLNLFFPTIASRCEMIKFYPVTKGEIKDFLKTQELSAEEIEDIIKLSAGRPGEAVDLAVDKSKLEKHRQAIEELKDILNSNLGSRFRYVKDLDKEKEEEGAIDAKGILNVWLGFFRDMLLFELEYPEKKNSFGYSVPKIEDIIKKTQEIIFLTSSTNANKKLALETLMLEF